MTASAEAVTAGGYILDTAWHAERERLDSITRLYDPTTLALCKRLGATHGWRCADVAPAPEASRSRSARSSRRWDRGGARCGHALSRPDRHPAAAGRLLRRDSRVAAGGPFDLVHARLLLEHLVERDAVLESMVQATRRGGWVLIEDFDWSTAW